MRELAEERAITCNRGFRLAIFSGGGFASQAEEMGKPYPPRFETVKMEELHFFTDWWNEAQPE